MKRVVMLAAVAACAMAQGKFTDVTAAAGIQFKHNAGKTG